MNKQERDEDRALQRALRERREVEAELRRRANADLREGHAAEAVRLARERDEKLADQHEHDAAFEAMLAEFDRTGQRLSPTMQLRKGYYTERQKAAARVRRGAQ
ncbi:hypothetical protein BH20ACT9_BH20ACT9_06070 [soil metagenome]